MKKKIPFLKFIQQTEFTDTSSTSSVFDAEDMDDTLYRHEDQQSFTERLHEPEVSGLWDWDSKVPRGNTHKSCSSRSSNIAYL